LIDVIANGSLHFGADVPTRHVIQIILEHCGIVIANRGAGKTTALLEYVAIRRFYKRTPPVAVLSPNEEFEHCPRKPNGPNPSNGYGPTGLDIGQWSMAHRWKL